jgi:hypothetical protein
MLFGFCELNRFSLEHQILSLLSTAQTKTCFDIVYPPLPMFSHCSRLVFAHNRLTLLVYFQHARFLSVGVLLTGRAVLWRLTPNGRLDRH